MFMDSLELMDSLERTLSYRRRSWKAQKMNVIIGIRHYEGQVLVFRTDPN